MSFISLPSSLAMIFFTMLLVTNGTPMKIMMMSCSLIAPPICLLKMQRWKRKLKQKVLCHLVENVEDEEVQGQAQDQVRAEYFEEAVQETVRPEEELITIRLGGHGSVLIPDGALSRLGPERWIECLDFLLFRHPGLIDENWDLYEEENERLPRPSGPGHVSQGIERLAGPSGPGPVSEDIVEEEVLCEGPEGFDADIGKSEVVQSQASTSRVKREKWIKEYIKGPKM